jgi:cephalosporin-C deacetylase-like acetyl esterase
LNIQTAATESFWRKVVEEVGEIEIRRADVDPIELRSTDFSDLFGVELSGTGGQRLFAYYSVPHGDGPFPAILIAPGYGSVVQVPPHGRRRGFAVLALCARGQRMSDGKYAASFPGLLTDQITNPAEYPFRGMTADCLTAFDFLVSRPEVDPLRIGIASGPGAGDLAFLTAALRREARAVLINSPLLFRDAASRYPATSAYPLEELNDYLRANPDDGEAVLKTLSLFDPIGLADRVEATVRISCAPVEVGWVSPLVRAVSGDAEIYEMSGRGYIDHTRDEAWLASALAG